MAGLGRLRRRTGIREGKTHAAMPHDRSEPRASDAALNFEVPYSLLTKGNANT